MKDFGTIERTLIATALVESHGAKPMPVAPPAPRPPAPAPVRPPAPRYQAPAPRPVQQGPTVINNYHQSPSIWPWVWLASQDHC